MQFPKMSLETIISVVIFLLLGAWGVKSCRDRKNDQTAAPAGTESTISNPNFSTSTGASSVGNSSVSSLPSDAPPLTPSNPSGTLSQSQQYGVASSKPAPRTPADVGAPPPVPNTGTDFVPKGGTVSTTQPPRSTVSTEGGGGEGQANGSRLYVLREGLKVRTQPDLAGRSLGKLRKNDEVYYMDEVTSNTTQVRLENGTIVEKPWFKIKTKRGTIGWVHGSGVDFYRRRADGTL